MWAGRCRIVHGFGSLIVLIVNGERIQHAVIQREAEELRAGFQRMSEQERSRYGLKTEDMERTAFEWSLENVIERTLLRQEAERDADPVLTDEVETAPAELKNRGNNGRVEQAPFDEDVARREIETRIRLDRLLGKITARVSAPKNKELADYYRKNKERFREPETVQAAHIVKNIGDGVTEEEASEAMAMIWKELQAGASFEALADRHSDCPGEGGDLGCFPRGEMVEEFDRVVFSLDAGGVSSVFQTVFGFHIAKVYRRFPEHMKTLAQAREEIREQLRKAKETRAVERFVDALRARADIREERDAEAAGVSRR